MRVNTYEIAMVNECYFFLQVYDCNTYVKLLKINKLYMVFVFKLLISWKTTNLHECVTFSVKKKKQGKTNKKNP